MLRAAPRRQAKTLFILLNVASMRTVNAFFTSA
jgi:hypothetical protein